MEYLLIMQKKNNEWRGEDQCTDQETMIFRKTGLKMEAIARTRSKNWNNTLP